LQDVANFPRNAKPEFRMGRVASLFLMPNVTTAAAPQTIAGFHALSEPLRLQILDLLRMNELCVCDLCEMLDVPQSKLSFHLKVLREAELVRTRQAGRWIYYSLNLPQIVVLEQFLSDFRRFGSIMPARFCQDDESLR
jgi:ArsR family transcriptional regulator